VRAAIIKSVGNVSVETVDDPTPGQAGFEGEFAPCAGDAWTRILRSLALS
jgi:hypothetical protein